MEALQLLFLLLPQANRSLLKLLLDLLYHTAKQQDKNKMSSFNLALMFAPHILWPRHVRRVHASLGRLLDPPHVGSRPSSSSFCPAADDSR